MMTRKLVMFLNVVSLNEGSSDNNPMLNLLGSGEEESDEKKTKIDWKKFRHVMRVPKIYQTHTLDELEQAVKDLETNIHQLLKDSAVKNKGDQKTNSYGDIPEGLKKVIRQKNKARRQER